MKKLYFCLFAASLITLAFDVSTNAQSKFSKVVMQPALWEKMKFQPKSECSAGLQDCAKSFLEQAGVELGAKPTYEFFSLGEIGERNLTIAFVTMKVTDDDSLTGIRYRLALSLGDVEDTSYKLENLGRQFTCARGHKSWSKARCP